MVSFDAPQSLMVRKQKTLPWIWALNGSIALHYFHRKWRWHGSCQPLKQGSPNNNIKHLNDAQSPSQMVLPLLQYVICAIKGTIYPKHNQSQLVPISCISPNTVLHNSWFKLSTRSDLQITSKLEPRRGRKGHTGLVEHIITFYTQHTISISNKLRRIIPSSR